MVRPQLIHPIWLVVASLSVTSVAIWQWHVRTLGRLVDSMTVPWLVLVIGFALAEMFVVHVHFRSEATTFSFLEVPLLLGIIFAPGSHVWSAMTIGVAFSLLTIRRQPPIKTAFNTANLSLQAAVCITIVHTLLPAGGLLAPSGWLVAAMAATVSSWTAIAAIGAAIVLSEGRADYRRIGEMMAFGSVVALTNTAVALLAGSLIDYRGSSVALLLVPVLVLYIAYRSYVSERAQRERVQFLYQSASDLRTMDHRASIPELLKNSASLFRAHSTYLFVVPTATDDHSIQRFSADLDSHVVDDLDSASSASVSHMLQEVREPQLLTTEFAEQLGSLCRVTPHTGMIGALHDDSGPIALFLVINRLGDVTGFTADDLALFSTLADQLALGLVNDHLEQAVTALQQLKQELAHKATHDGLTGLADRSVLTSLLDAGLADERPTCLLFIDLDDFKVVNDSLGHQAGDAVLIATSERLLAEVRPSDCVARVGGDEFAVALFDAVDPEEIAQRIIDSLHAPVQIAGHEVKVGASIGLALASDDQTTAELLAHADIAMYAAKAKGKGAVEMYRRGLPGRFSSQP